MEADKMEAMDLVDAQNKMNSASEESAAKPARVDNRNSVYIIKRLLCTVCISSAIMCFIRGQVSTLELKGLWLNRN